jgi:predicted ATPase/DNA-binding SARP family transcriptional activator
MAVAGLLLRSGVVEVRVLGQVELVDGGSVVRLPRAERTLLAALTSRAGDRVSVDMLEQALWGENPPPSARKTLQVYVVRLRKVVGAAAITERDGGYLLDTDRVDVDAARVANLVAEARAALRAGDPDAAAGLLAAASTMFRGDPYEGVAEEALPAGEVARLQELRLSIVEESAEAELACARGDRCAAELEACVQANPYRERAWGLLMRAMYQAGRPADALAAYGRARIRLAADLGIEPGPALREIEQAILTHDSGLAGVANSTARLGPSNLPAAVTPLAGRDLELVGPSPDGQRRHQTRRRIDNLPAAVSPLLGRKAEVDEVRLLLMDQQCRLVTLCGPGGTGKTRLALAVTEQLAADAADGACNVDLAPLRDDHQVLPAVATALGVTARNPAELEAAVAAFLRPRQLVMILDNFEHVLSAWSVPSNLLTAAPRLVMLITSRTPLGISGEQQYDVQPLAVPRRSPLPPLEVLAGIAAVELFTTRARLVEHQFQLTEHNARSIAEICRRLDGLPLAVELSAAHARTLTPDEMLDALEDRLSLLDGGPRDRPVRQQTLRAAIAWSYDALTADEQAVFAQLAVFAGAPLVSDVVAICDPVDGAPASTVDALERLANASLIRRQRDDLGGPRVLMLQTIREFARTELMAHERDPTLHRRHADHYTALAESMAAELNGPDQSSAFKRLRAEDADLYGALVWAASDDGDVDLALRLIGHLWHYWEIAGDVTAARKTAEAVLERAADAPLVLLAPALSGVGTLCWLQGDIGEAARLHEKALDAYQAIGHPAGIAWSQMCLATQAAVRSEFAVAETLADNARRSASTLTDHRTVAFALVILGVLAWYQHDGPRARDLQEEALDICRRAGDEWAAAKPLINLADIAEGLGEYDRATMLLLQALRTSRDMGDRALAVVCVEAIAELRLRVGLPTHAARLLAACDTYRTDMALPLDDRERELRDDILGQARLAAGIVNFSIAWTEGSSLSLEEAAEEALATVD